MHNQANSVVSENVRDMLEHRSKGREPMAQSDHPNHPYARFTSPDAVDTERAPLRFPVGVISRGKPAASSEEAWANALAHRRRILTNQAENQSRGYRTSTANPRETTDQPLQPDDPRWVLAIRASQALQGTILTLDHREKLVSLGKKLGLTAFDSNLILAVVQDQARRGNQPNQCPAAGEPQLRMIPLPERERSSRMQKMANIGLAVVLLIGVELLILHWLFG